MKALLSSLLIVLLVVLFTMAVYTYGTDYRYSLWNHFGRITEQWEETPSLQDLSGVWMEDVSLYDGDNEILEFFENIGIFFVRLGNTVWWFFEWLSAVFYDVTVLIPWFGLEKVV